MTRTEYIATQVAGAYLSAHPHGQTPEEVIAGLAQLIDSSGNAFDRAGQPGPELPAGHDCVPDSVLIAASERFLDDHGFDIFGDLLNADFDLAARRRDAVDALRKEIGAYVGRGNELAEAV